MAKNEVVTPGHSKNFFLFFVFLIVIIFLLEAFSFSILMIGSIVFKKNSLSDTLKYRLAELQIAWKRKTSYGGFDPLMQVRHLPCGRYHNLTINEHGFIDNGHRDTFLNSFPDKPDGLIRVILLGGSSAAGSGMERNCDTISAILEKMLNSHFVHFGKRYQVLNFGAAGGYTGAELIKFLMMLIYVEPDIVICLDGFNDAWNVLLEHNRVGIPYSIINWSDYSYGYFEFMNGCSRRYIPFKIFTFTSSLLQRIQGRFMSKKIYRLYEAYPFYKLSGFVMKKYPLLDTVTYNNLDALGAYATNNDIKLLCYLQPHALNGKKDLTMNEKKRLKEWFYIYDLSGANFKEDTYKNLMNSAFLKFEGVYSGLEKKYEKFPRIHFYSISDIFFNVGGDIYMDTIHYTKLGNEIIARRFFGDIIKLEEISQDQIFLKATKEAGRNLKRSHR